MKEFRLMIDGAETIARVKNAKEDIGQSAEVLCAMRDSSGWSWWYFFDYTREKITSKAKLAALIEKNRNSGFSVGMFDSIAELNADLKAEEMTEFGFFGE